MHTKVKQQLANGRRLLATWRGLAVAARAIWAAGELVDVHNLDGREFDTSRGKPCIKLCLAPNLGSHANDGIALIDQ